MKNCESIEQVGSMLRSVGVHAPFSMEPLPGGGNNRVYLVEAGGSSFLLKQYYQDADTTKRDRLQSEFSFSSFAWNSGIRSIPKPMISSSPPPLALYEYIDGFPLVPEEITRERIREAGAFFTALNQRRESEEAKSLMQGAEACFSLGQHLECVGQRVAALCGMNVSSPLEAEAKRFVVEILYPLWREISALIRRQAVASSLDIAEELAPEDRCISPSDFGFHNALRDKRDGKLRFFDFEYAGWDDPAKVVCDFFCQPQLPVPLEFYDLFASEVAALFTDPRRHRRRFELLHPLYQIKWCCIMLNPFLPEDGRRRRYAMQHHGDFEDYRKHQLSKVEECLSHIDYGEVQRVIPKQL